MTKNIIVIFLLLFIFTESLILFHNSKFQKGEFDRICNSIYTEKVWIDKCYFPYNTEIKTFILARDIEIVGIILGLGAFLTAKRSNG